MLVCFYSQNVHMSLRPMASSRGPLPQHPTGQPPRAEGFHLPPFAVSYPTPTMQPPFPSHGTLLFVDAPCTLAIFNGSI